YIIKYDIFRTNLPKEVMGFPDFPIPDQKKSYLTQAEILDFLNLYADRFNLKPLVKFNSIVTDVRPLEDNTWQVTYIYKPSNEKISNIYDAVMICNGHYNDPVVPKIQGQEKFKGKIEHSHNFRSPELYKDQRILVIGAGPSGLDLTLQVSEVAKYARYFCKSLNGSMALPTMEDMRMHTESEMQSRWAKGYTKRQAHMMGQYQEFYYNDLAADANTIPIAPVLVKLRDLSVKRLYDDLLNFREDRYKIVDTENFIKVQ
ncbi:hypothetical protein NQ314_000766, partial [Rhamnusium bicolor]